MFGSKEKKAMMQSMQQCLSDVQENNKMLATTLQECFGGAKENAEIIASALTQLANRQSQGEAEKKMDPWKAVYALNLCTVSVSQIIETNDMRFMEQEYENILNNLNLEMMPKDEALLDTLKQILDVINYFKIQSKEKELLDKEYQQKLKDAVWCAVPSPSVILAGGKAGWVGLAASAAVAVGTSYMNYRKEKAKIETEQERKNWELERSAMEQLHGLQRQLFETAWRLADIYQFDDRQRLTERQIKQYLDILTDTDHLRRYHRLDYIHKKFEAYPPFWYHMGSAALQYAHKESDWDLCCEYLLKAKCCFDEYEKMTKKENRLLREDPVVAQCTFEYITVMNILQEKGCLPNGEYSSNDMERRLDAAVESAGNALDVLQQCALNYLALGNKEKAITIMKALVSEQYNMHSNVQLLSVIYVEQHLNGRADAKSDYDTLGRLADSAENIYPFVFTVSEKEAADIEFLRMQKISLAERIAKAIDVYLVRGREEFDALRESNYDITEDTVGFFDKLAADFKELFPNAHSNLIASIKNYLQNNNRGGNYISSRLAEKQGRDELYLDSILYDFISNGVRQLISQIGRADNMKSLSHLESKVFAFCEKQNILDRLHRASYENAKNRKSVEGVLLGDNLASYIERRSMLEKYLQTANDPKYKNALITDSKEVEYLTRGNAKLDDYLQAKIYEKLPSNYGEVFAIIRDQKSTWFVRRDLVFTTTGLYILGNRDQKDSARYSQVLGSDDNSALLKRKTRQKREKFYGEPGVDYKLLNDMISALRVVELSENREEQNPLAGGLSVMQLIGKEISEW